MTDPISRLDVSREDLYAIEVELGEAGMATVSKSPRVMRTHLSGLLTFVLVNLAGCGGTTDPSVATTVILSRWFEGTYRTQPDPEATTLSFSSFGDTQQLIATAWDQNGARISGAPVTWASSRSSVASVSSTGLVAAVADGMATITATSGSANATASVTVFALPLLQPSEFCGDFSDSDIATFEDTNLARALRDHLEAMEGGEFTGLASVDDLTCSLVSGLEGQLFLGGRRIVSLVGIHNLTSVTILLLADNWITDIDLSGLPSLTYLELSNNSINNVALSGLTSLGGLDLSNNRNLTDIQPLFDNTGLGAGNDTVDLRSTGVSCADVAWLKAQVHFVVHNDCD